MNFIISGEREELLSQHKKERDSRICDRLKVILWYDSEKSIEEISELLFLNTETVRRHIKEYREKKKLKPLNRGSRPKLSEEQNKKLSDHIEEKTYTKVKEISDYILKTYGIKYSNSGLTNWLYENGFTYKKPVGLPSKIDEKAQEAFIKEYRKIEKNLQLKEEILFMDSCHPTQATKFGYGWIKKGKAKQIKTTASRTRINITGAININSRKVITETYETINSINLIKFLKKSIITLSKIKKNKYNSRWSRIS